MAKSLVITDPETIAIIRRRAAELGTAPEGVVLQALRAFEASLPPLDQAPASEAVEPPDFIARALTRAASARAALPPGASPDQGEPYEDPDLR